MPLPITLTRDDWIEISAALMTKRMELQRGEYSPCDDHTKRPCKCDREWIDHLALIEKQIGPDGELAAKRGVAPVVGV